MKRKFAIFVLLALLLAVLVLPAQAEEGLGYVTDEAGLLTEEEYLQLESLCQTVSEEYGVGVYIVTVEDYTACGEGDVYEVTWGLYHKYNLGKGEERNGIILLLSMAERDYATFVYGSYGEYAFTEFGLFSLEEEFLPHLGENDWYEGFRTYAVTCREYLGMAAAGEPMDEGDGIIYVMVISISFLIALIVVSIMRIGMKNVKHQREAGVYVSRDLQLTQQRDQFTHITTTRRKIETNTNSGTASRAHVGGGGHGRSGKF